MSVVPILLYREAQRKEQTKCKDHGNDLQDPLDCGQCGNLLAGKMEYPR